MVINEDIQQNLSEIYACIYTYGFQLTPKWNVPLENI